MDFLLRIKHWQLFLLIVTVPILAYIFMFYEMMNVAMNAQGFDDGGAMPAGFVSAIVVLMVASLVCYFFLFTWFFKMGTGFYSKLPVGHTMKIGRFYFAFFFPVIYFIVMIISIIIGMLFTEQLESLFLSMEEPPLSLIFLLMFCHFLALFCIFYNFRFVAKSLKSIELNRQARFGDYVGEFVLLWFFFIGVWFIQPRVNRIFSDEPSIGTIGGPLDQN